MELEIRYQDEQLVAVYKPAGLIVHRNEFSEAGEDSLLMLLRRQLDRYLFPVQRLDKGTSGLMLFGLEKEAARQLADSFMSRKVEKQYLAIVRGHPPAEQLIERPLRRKPHPDFQEARTRFRTLARAERPWPIGRYSQSRYALLEVDIFTGRWHQIRRHLAFENHPIIGDRKHGDRDHNRYFEQQLKLDRLMLHAARLRLPHPKSGKMLELSAPPEGQFAQAQALLFGGDV
jgi:tRNA pseudouridine65 synthase